MRTTLFGRDRQQAAIDAALAAAAARQLAVVIIEGGWGTGKSAMLEHGRAAAVERGLLVASGRASADRADAASPLIADLVERLRPAAATPMLGASLVRSIAAVAPLALCIDDAHRIDRESAEALVEMLGRVDGMGLALLLSGTAGWSETWDTVRAAAARAPGSQFVRLAPLDPADAARMLADGELDAEQVEAAWVLSGGKPLLLRACVDIARAGGSLRAPSADDVPDAVRHRIVALLRDLEAPERLLVEVAAIAAVAREATDPTFANVVLGVAGLDRGQAPVAIDRLVDAGLLASRDLRFVTPLGSLAVVATMPVSQRERIHGAMANALWSAGGSNDRVVAHLWHTPPGGSAWAVGMLRSAALEAGARADHAEEVRLLRRALDEQPLDAVRASLLAALARAEGAAGLPEAIGRVERAVARQPDPDRRAELRYAVGRSLLAAGRAHHAVAVFERGLEAHRRDDGGWRLLFRAGLSEASRLHPDLWMRARGELDRLLVDDLPPLDRASRATLAGRAFEMQARNEPAAQVAAIALRSLPDPESADIDDPALVGALGVLIYAGAIEQSSAALDAILRRAGDGGSSSGALAGLRFRRGQCLAYRGELRRARDELSFAVASDPHGWRQYTISAYAHLARVKLELGDVDGVERLMREAFGDPAAHESTLAAELHEARGRLRLAQRRPREALADFREAGRRVSDVFECSNPSMSPWRGGAAFAANRLGANAAALRLSDDEIRDARRFGEPLALARSLRIGGLVRSDAAGVDMLREALSVIESTDARLEHAHVLTDLGGALRRNGRRREALAHLRAAADLADRSAAAALSVRIAESIRLSGGRPRRTHVTGPLALTPAESRVAQRARDGATNRQIAQELYVSTKAIEFHLGNVYRKLGIRSRRDLGTALPGDEPTPPRSR